MKKYRLMLAMGRRDDDNMVERDENQIILCTKPYPTMEEAELDMDVLNVHLEDSKYVFRKVGVEIFED